MQRRTIATLLLTVSCLILPTLTASASTPQGSMKPHAATTSTKKAATHHHKHARHHKKTSTATTSKKSS